MAEVELSSLLELRLLVGYLGEKDQFGWWASSFYEPAAMQFLTPAFPRTARLAQYNGVREAARRVHDASVGIGRVFHLFRLPEEVEQDLHRCAEKLTDDHPFISNVQSKTTATARLLALAGENPQGAEGPIAIGSIADMRKATSLARLAANYSRAFAKRSRVYPYFTS